jgi:type VI secretion system protein ImpF
MAKIQTDQSLVPSVLDRLLDEDPSTRREAGKPRHQVLREVKMSVRRDLEALLNTRRRALGWPAELTELEKSLVNYGLADFTGANMGSVGERERLCRMIGEAIGNWETRFKSVDVRLQESADQLDRTLRFRIDALLHASPAPEPIVFDSAMQPTTGTIEVKGVNA